MPKLNALQTVIGQRKYGSTALTYLLVANATRSLAFVGASYQQVFHHASFQNPDWVNLGLFTVRGQAASSTHVLIVLLATVYDSQKGSRLMCCIDRRLQDAGRALLSLFIV